MGPTAAGKSALALKVAHAFDGEIITADSRQIYLGMDIGTDKPTPQGRPEPMRKTSARQGRNASSSPQHDTPRDAPLLVEGIPHYLIDILTPDQRYSAAEFRDDATRIIAEIHQRGKLPVVVGGTGFYIRVLTGDRALQDVPPDQGFRAWAETQPIQALTRELKERAPDLYARIDNPTNKRRVARALEIAKGRGKRPPTASRARPPAWKTLKLALLPSPEVLREHIEARVADQLRRGLIEEVRSLVAQYGADAPGLQAVGYRQVFPHLRGQATLDETRQAIIRANRQYARRQWTWLKKEPRLAKASSPEEAHRAVTAWLLGANQKRGWSF